MELSKDYLRSVFPDHFKTKINDKFVESLRDIIEDPDYRDHFRETLINVTDIIADTSYSMSHYINAIKFVTFIAHGDKQRIAYSKVFPERYDECITKGIDVSSRASSFAGSKLVKKIEQRIMVPTYLLNNHRFQEAINKQVQLMNTSDSDIVQQRAADSLMAHLKPPEELDINIHVQESSVSIIDELRFAALEIAKIQKKQLSDGVIDLKTASIQKVRVINPDD